MRSVRTLPLLPRPRPQIRNFFIESLVLRIAGWNTMPRCCIAQSQPAPSAVHACLRVVTVIAFLCVSALVTNDTIAQDDAPDAAPRLNEATFAAAGDGDHLWYIEPAPRLRTAAFRLMHQAPNLREREAVTVTTLDDVPRAMAAGDTSVFMIFDAPREGARQTRTVTTVRAVYDQAVRAWRYAPVPSGRTLPTLPGQGRIAGTVVHQQDLMVLLVPDGGSATPGENDPEWMTPVVEMLAQGRPVLLRLHFGAWSIVDLPASVTAHADVKLICGQYPTVLVPADASHETSIRYELRTVDPISWIDIPTSVPFDQVRSGASVMAHTAIALADPTEPDSLRIVYLRGAESYDIQSLQDVPPTHTLVPYRGDMAVTMQRDPESAVSLVGIAFLTGEVKFTVDLGQAPPVAHDDFGPLILIGALLIATLVMFLFRPDPMNMKIVLPPNTALAEPARRLVGVMIDLLPAGVLSALILEVPFSEVMRWPLLTHRVDDVMPAVLMIALCMLHSTVCEFLWARTLGKWFMACRVANVTGEAPGGLQIILRNAMKLVALIVPPLVLFVFLNPYRQRLGDLAARTVVVVELEATEVETAKRDTDDASE